MRFILIAFSLMLILSCKEAQVSPEKVSELLTGEWRIQEFEWESKSQLSSAEREAFQQAARLQERRFQEFSHFEFNSDKTYRMDFTGKGGDFGTWSITQDLKLANMSERYNLPDTVNIDYYSRDTFRLTIIDSLQEAKVTIIRKQ
jgi:hypothetical protein